MRRARAVLGEGELDERGPRGRAGHGAKGDLLVGAARQNAKVQLGGRSQALVECQLKATVVGWNRDLVGQTMSRGHDWCCAQP